MEKVQLVLAIHSHQPVGNFDSVFERATQQCYRPFLEILERHPTIRLALHYSGPLLEWLETHQPEMIGRIATLCERGQVELLGGGFYEPMLSVLPHDDALGQIAMMSAYLEDRFATKPEGLWLTERVWEPELASLLAEASVRYTLVDDTHFFYAGVEPRRLFGYYVTEKAGNTLAIFPIDKVMRYAIPFKPVDELLGELRRETAEGPRGVVYGDDGEKFGIWPHTHEWVFEKGWLESFFSAVEQADWLSVMSPGDYMKRFPRSGRIYLPTASYEEMLTWAMPAEAIHRYEDLKQDLERVGLSEKAKPFIRGGLWQNFMSKYAEANHLHKKMLLVSRKLNEALVDGEPWTEGHEEARRSLFRGQCNCAYWHGLFGGLYLPHLRDAVTRQLIRAETILDERAQGHDDWIAFDERDFDGDLEDEVIVENDLISVYLDPGEGGVITEIDYRPAAFCLTNTLTRRMEGYHRQIKLAPDAEDEPVGDRPKTIHEIVRATQPGLSEKLTTDRHPRRCLMERFPALQTTLEDLQRATYTEEGDFLGARYHVERVGIDEEGNCDFQIHMARPGHLLREGRKLPLIVEKLITVPADRAEVRVEYTLVNPGADPLRLVFCPEYNLTLLAGDDGMRLFEFEGLIGPGPRMRTSGEVEEASWFALVDFYQRLRIRFEFDPVCTMWRHPVETVSQSESGFELLYQGSALLPKWELTIEPRMHRKVVIRAEIMPVDEDAVVPAPAEPDKPSE